MNAATIKSLERENRFNLYILYTFYTLSVLYIGLGDAYIIYMLV